MRIVEVDAFTDRRFSGNPAAVCVLDRMPYEGFMRDLAREMNLSETAFAAPRTGDGYDLRWFTPEIEVDLCGHATIATAHVMWEDGHAAEQIAFHTRSGVLTAVREDDWIVLDFPARRAVEAPVPPEVIAAVGGSPAVTARGEVGAGMSGYLLEYATEAEVRSLAPDFAALREVPDAYVIATAPASTDGFDFVSRFFGPGAGVDEDPATGSSHCALGPWWQGRLGKDVLLGYQCSARGGTIRVRPNGERVGIAGKAVTVWRGELIHEATDVPRRR